MIRLNYSVIILIIIITIFGFVFPFLSWIEERKISTILQSLSILTVYSILFFQTFREKLKNKKSLTMIIHYLENLIGLICEYNTNLAVNEITEGIDEFKNRQEALLTSEISIFKDWYQEDLRKLHCYIRELDNLISILIQFQDKRYIVNYKGVYKYGKGRSENITCNLNETKELIKRLYKLI